MTRLLAYLGLTALIFSTACAMVTLLLAIALTMHGSSISPLALTAGILDVLGIGWVAYLLTGITSKDQAGIKRRRLPTITLVPSMLLSSVAISLTFATLIWVHIGSLTTLDTIFGNRIYLINKIDFGFWAATLVSQSLFIALCFHEPSNRRSLPQGSVLPQDLVDAILHTQQEPQGVPQPVPLRTLVSIPAIPPYARSIASSHSASSFSSDGKSTIRSSFHGAVRPVTSRSRLIRQNSWAGPSNSVSSLTIPRQRQTYDSTLSSRRSSADQSVPEEADSPHTPVKTRLETIPGSRANSPARALDGPFPDQPLAEETSTTPEASQTPSPVTDKPVELPETLSENAVNDNRIPPRFRKEHPQSRPTSPGTVDQSLIHPLFRADSSEPAPNATSGTTVVASAFGGKCMTPRSLSRVTTLSRPSSPEQGEIAERSRARSQSRPPNTSGSQLAPPPSAARAKSMEAVQTRRALQDISGNAIPITSVADPPEREQNKEEAALKETFHIAIDDE